MKSGKKNAKRRMILLCSLGLWFSAIQIAVSDPITGSAADKGGQPANTKSDGDATQVNKVYAKNEDDAWQEDKVYRLFDTASTDGVAIKAELTTTPKPPDFEWILTPPTGSTATIDSPGDLITSLTDIDVPGTYKLKARCSTADEGKTLSIIIPKVDINVHYNIDGIERKLQVDTSQAIIYCQILGGMREKLTCSVEPPQVQVSSHNWTYDSGSFYDSYHVAASTLSSTDTDELYWEGTIPGSQPGENEVTATVTINPDFDKTIKLKHRLLQQGSQGDDVKMLQDLLNFLGWSTLTVDGIFGGNTEDRVVKFKKQNYGTWTTQDGQVTPDVVKILNHHFDDYRAARNAFGWDNGENPDANNATIDQTHADFKKDNETDADGWVEIAAGELTSLPAGVITPNPAWSTDKRDLLLAMVAQESSNVHWNNWRVIMSPGVGAIGFLQIMPFNSKRYNAAGTIPQNTNIYRPDHNLKAGAQFMDDACLASAFYGWQVAGDDDDDLLAKALAYYNGGQAATLNQYSWENICDNQRISLQSLRYAVQIKVRLGLTIEAFEQPYQ